MSTRAKQLRAVFLTAVMVVSVLAMTTGAMAAKNYNPDQPQRSVDAVVDDSLADSNPNKTLTVTVTSDDSNFGGDAVGSDDIDAINISFNRSVDVSNIDGRDIHIFENGTNVSFAKGMVVTNTTASEDAINISGIGGNFTDPTANDRHLTIVIDNFGNPTANASTTVTLYELGGDNDGADQSSSDNLAVYSKGSSNAPILINNTLPYSTLHGALASNGSVTFANELQAGSTVTVQEDINASPVRALTANLTVNDVTISGSGNPTVTVPTTFLNMSSSSEQINSLVAVEADNAMVRDLTFSGEASNLTTSVSAISTNNVSAANLTIYNNTVENVSGPAAFNVTPGSSNNNVQTLNISSNTLGTNGTSYGLKTNAINVTTGYLNNNAEDKVLIKNNNINLTASDTEDNDVGIIVDEAFGVARTVTVQANVTIAYNKINGHRNDVTGISLANTNNMDADVDIIGGTINNTDIGINNTNDVGFVNITDVNLKNISTVDAGDGAAGVDLTSTTTANIDGLSIVNSSGVHGVNTSGGRVTLTINSSTFETVLTGYNKSGASEFNISDSTFSNVSNQAIDVRGGTTNPAGIDNVTIQNSSGATGVRAGNVPGAGGALIDIKSSTIDNIATGFANDAGAEFNVTATTFSNVSSVAIDIQGATSNPASIVGTIVKNSAGADGIQAGVGTKFYSNSSTFTTVGVGIDVNGGVAADLNVTNTSVTDVTGGPAIGLDTTTANDVDLTNVTVTNATGSTAVDMTAAAVFEINDTSVTDAATGLNAGSSTTLNVTNADLTNISGTAITHSSGSLNVSSSMITNASNATDISTSGAGASDIGYMSNTIQQSDIGLYVNGDGAFSNRIVVHWNTFQNNNESIVVEDSFANSGSGGLNATFNDFLNNDPYAFNISQTLNTTAFNTSGANTNFSALANYYGTDYGPGGAVSGNAFAVAGSITLGVAINATPFLTQSVSNFDQNSTDLLLVTDETEPYMTGSNGRTGGDENENATMVAVVLDDGAVANVGTVNLNNQTGKFGTNESTTNVSVQRTGGSVHKSLGVQWNVSANISSVPFKVLDSNTNSAPDTANQTFANQLDSISVSANKTSLAGDGQDAVKVTLTLLDSDGNRINNTGTNVGWTLTGDTSGVSTTRETSTYGGQASIEVSTTNDNATITVKGFDGRIGDSGSVTINSNPGAVDAQNTRFLLNNQTADPGDQQAGSQHHLAVQARDAANNNLSSVTVNFSANTSGTSFASSSVTTGSNGWANTTVTLTNNSNVTTNISAVAGNFTPANTASAVFNVSTIPENATELQFESAGRNVPVGGSTNVTIQAVDKFGNVNETVTDSVTLSTNDSSVINVSNASSQTKSLSNGNVTFEVFANASSGAANLTAEASGYTNVTDTFTIGQPSSIAVSFNISRVSYDAKSNAKMKAQLKDSAGNNFSSSGVTIDFSRASGDAVSITGSTSVQTNGNGLATTTVSVVGQRTGDVKFRARNSKFSVGSTSTITAVGGRDHINFAVNKSTAQPNETVQLTVNIVDGQDRELPIDGQDVDIEINNGTVGQVNGSNSTTVTISQGSDGDNFNATTTINSSETGSVDLFAIGGGVEGSVTGIVTYQAAAQPTASVTFNDTTVTNGTETINVDMANYTLADGSAGEYVVVIHEVFDNGSVSGPVGYSSNQSGAASEIAVDLNASGAQNDGLDSLESNVTLQAMLHNTSGSSNFGSALMIGGSKVTDNATINVSAAAAPPALPGQAKQPTDPDGDGKYEDLDGDGSLGLNDVTVLFANRKSSVVKNNVDKFDFDDSGSITLNDVTVLFNDQQSS